LLRFSLVILPLKHLGSCLLYCLPFFLNYHSLSLAHWLFCVSVCSKKWFVNRFHASTWFREVNDMRDIKSYQYIIRVFIDSVLKWLFRTNTTQQDSSQLSPCKSNQRHLFSINLNKNRRSCWSTLNSTDICTENDLVTLKIMDQLQPINQIEYQTSTRRTSNPETNKSNIEIIPVDFTTCEKSME
jgi:hypothetical protein